MATALLKLARTLHAKERPSLLALARCLLVAGVLSAAGPVLAGSDRPDLENGTGDDPTQPLGKIELLDRYTEAPGAGVEEGTTKTIQTNTPFARIETPPLRFAPQWELNFRTEIPVVWTNGVTPTNPTGATVSGFGNVLGQAWVVHDLDQRWAVALGGQVIAPTSTNGVASDAWEEVTDSDCPHHASGDQSGQLFRSAGSLRNRFRRQRRRPHVAAVAHRADPQHQSAAQACSSRSTQAQTFV